jgi:hypothetical protein
MKKLSFGIFGRIGHREDGFLCLILSAMLLKFNGLQFRLHGFSFGQLRTICIYGRLAWVLRISIKDSKKISLRSALLPIRRSDSVHTYFIVQVVYLTLSW